MKDKFRTLCPDVLLGHLTLLAILFLSVWFAEERVLLTDSAYQLFFDINNGGMLINDHRYSMVLSQLLPWLLIKLHVPLKWLIVAYSVSFILIAYACWLIAIYLLHSRRAGLLMLFTFIGMRATFFHCISETFQLLFFASLFYALLNYGTAGKPIRRAVWLVTLLLTEALSFFIHPVAVFVLAFALGFRCINERRLRLESRVIVCTAALLLMVGVKTIVGQSGHDQSFLPTADTLRYAATHFFSLQSIQFFYAHFAEFYLFPILLWLLTVVNYAWRDLWWKMVYVGCAVAGFFALSVVIYWEGDSPIGMERTYLPLFFFIGLPFVSDVLPRLTKGQQKVYGIIFTALLTFSIIRIGVSTKPYNQRLNEIKKITTIAKSVGQHKLVITQSTAQRIFPINMWGLAIESLLYTAREEASQAATIYIESDDFDRTECFFHDPNVFVMVGWWKCWWLTDFNPTYFHLPKQEYVELVENAGEYKLLPLQDNL